MGLTSRRVLCLCFLRGGVLACILEHISICLTQCLPTGEVAVQKLIDAGALIVWKEANGLEMVAEFTREVGGITAQKNIFGGVRERFLLVCVCVCFFEHLFGPYEH